MGNATIENFQIGLPMCNAAIANFKIGRFMGNTFVFW